MKRVLPSLFCGLILTLPVKSTAGTNAWLHVQVDESGAKPTLVKVNLPVSVVELAAPLIQEKCAQHAKLKTGKKEFDKAQLQSIWNAVRAAQDGEFVKVQDDNENVSVSKSGDHLLVRVRESGKKHENVDVRVPLAVADALLAGPGDELDIMAAIHVLARQGKGELVTVNDDSSVVRIWIDEKNATK